MSDAVHVSHLGGVGLAERNESWCQCEIVGSNKIFEDGHWGLLIQLHAIQSLGYVVHIILWMSINGSVHNWHRVVAARAHNGDIRIGSLVYFRVEAFVANWNLAAMHSHKGLLWILTSFHCTSHIEILTLRTIERGVINDISVVTLHFSLYPKFIINVCLLQNL